MWQGKTGSLTYTQLQYTSPTLVIVGKEKSYSPPQTNVVTQCWLWEENGKEIFSGDGKENDLNLRSLGNPWMWQDYRPYDRVRGHQLL